MSKQKIFDATMELIEQYGTDVSVRKIAELADVNVAAISYHFGSKDQLMSEIIKFKLENFKHAFDILEDAKIQPIDRLELFLCKIIEVIQTHPEVAEYVVSQEELFKSRYEYQNYLDIIGYQKLVNTIVEITGTQDSFEITVMIEQLLASSVMSYINGMRISKINTEFQMEPDYEYRVKIFISNYFNKYIETDGK
ncbi:helix-turn-helix domain-containing protein [Mollicutes bacterium LVI A0039]|nr:helix-turn-helix domain-containing protein [Mollicutes bacterium LVI A0039]